jgi:hypothetical protein
MSLRASREERFHHFNRSASGDGRNQQYLITVIEIVLQASKEANILIVDVDIQKTLRRAVLGTKHFLDAGKLLVEPVEKFTKVLGRGFNAFGALSVLPQWWGDTNCDLQSSLPPVLKIFMMTYDSQPAWSLCNAKLQALAAAWIFR